VGADQVKFAAGEEFPFDLLPRPDADGGGEGGRDGDVEAWFLAAGADHLHFYREIHLHTDRIAYKIAVVKGGKRMGVKKLSGQRSLFEAGVYLAELLGRGNGSERFMFFHEKVWPELRRLEPELVRMYCTENGRPGESPVRLLGLSMLQFMEKVPDRQAVEAMTFDVRWKCALGMDLDEGAFHPTVLVRFRERLVAHGVEGIGFEAVLDILRQAGYLGKKTAQRLDSTHVLGHVAQMSRLECVREAMRLALEALEREERLARPEGWPVWWERYVDSRPDFRAEAEVLRLKMKQAGQDALGLLSWVEGLPEEVRNIEAVRLVARVFEENFESGGDGGVVPRRSQPPGAVQNPHDPEAQWSCKDTIKHKEWVGYKAQVGETAEEEPRAKREPTKAVITAMVTQEATASDKAALPKVEEGWEASDEGKPPVLYTDAGYSSGAELARAEEEGRELRAPVQSAPSREGRFSAEAFDVSVEQRCAVCPAGHDSTNCSRLEDGGTGKVTFRFEWNNGLCGACDLRGQCLGKGPSHRTLVVGEHHDLIQRRRREQKTEAFAKEMHRRHGIEGTISELTRGYDLRHCRYRGLAKTRLQNFMIGAACNIKRWWRRVTWEQRNASRNAVKKGIAAARA